METALNRANLRHPSAWIDGVDAARLEAAILALQTSLRDARPGARVLLLAQEPQAMLAGILAAFAAEKPVRLFCGSSRWGASERAAVRRDLQPDFIWGDSGPGESAAKPDARSGFQDATGPDPRRESTLVMIPTGGTTGRIRFAVHTTATLAAAAAGLQQWLGGGPVNSVCLLPLDHVSGLMQVVRAWHSDGRLALAAWAEVEAGRFPEPPAEPAVTSLVPTQLARLLASPAAVAWLRRFRAVFLGGAAPWPALLDAARSARLPVALCYGSTETAAQVAAQRPEDFLAGAPAAVAPLPHAVVDIVAGDGLSALPAGEEGRIRVRSAALFLGYWPDPGLEHSRRGHLTGDRGTLDRAGRLVVRGRADDLINTGGEKVDPAEVEAAIRETGLVDDVAVCGVPDTDWGEVVVAVIVGGRPEAGTALLERLRGRLAGHQVPKRIVRVSSLNRSESGKLDRRALTRLAGGEKLPP